MSCIMMSPNVKDTAALAESPSSSSSSTTGGFFSRQSIHSFLDMLMDMFLMDSSSKNKDDETEGNINVGNVESLEGKSGEATCAEKTLNSRFVQQAEKQEEREDTESYYSNNSSVNEQYALQRQRSSFRNRKRRSTAFDGRESYDEADDSSVEDSVQDYQYVVGGMNMSRFGGVFGASGAGGSSTNSGCVSAVSGRTMSSVLTAVTERTDEEDGASVATAYRLGRTSCSSSQQQQQQQILSQLSSLSQAFLRSTKTNSFATPASTVVAAGGASLPTSPTESVVSQKQQQQQVAACAASRRSTQSTGEETEDDEYGLEKQMNAASNVVAGISVDKLESNFQNEVVQK